MRAVQCTSGFDIAVGSLLSSARQELSNKRDRYPYCITSQIRDEIIWVARYEVCLLRCVSLLSVDVSRLIVRYIV